MKLVDWLVEAWFIFNVALKSKGLSFHGERRLKVQISALLHSRAVTQVEHMTEIYGWILLYTIILPEKENTHVFNKNN